MSLRHLEIQEIDIQLMTKQQKNMDLQNTKFESHVLFHNHECRYAMCVKSIQFETDEYPNRLRRKWIDEKKSISN